MNRPAHLRTASPEFRFSNKLIAPVVGCGLILFLVGSAQAGSAIWALNPGSGDWNTAANWTPTTVPNGPADTAFFDLSNTTGLSTSANTEVNGIVFDSNAGLNPFTITASPGLTLTLSGTGVTNNSGATQNFVVAPSGGNFNALALLFRNSATAGNGTLFTTNGGTNFADGPGWIGFNDSSSAGSGTFTNNGPTTASITFGGGVTLFQNSATAASGTFINNGGTVSSQVNSTNGATIFNDTSTAGNGIFTNNAATVSGGDGGLTAFSGNNSTAGTATITNNGSTVSGAGAGRTDFDGIFGTATAGDSTIINDGATVSGASGGVTSFEGFFDIVSGRGFFGSSTAGNATIINNGTNISGAGAGETVFFTDFNSSNPLGASTAGNATLIANGGTGGGQGGQIIFEGHSIGGTSRVEVFGNGSLDISLHDPPSQKFPGVPLGSIEGDGNVFLGANNLIVGTNDKSTSFSGVIQDGGQNGGTGGSLTKIGSGTLDLTRANTYTGSTNINGGVLQVDGSITSNTFVTHGGTLAGTGTVIGNVTNSHVGTVRPGDASGGTLTVNSYTTQMGGGTLLIDIAGLNPGQFSVLDVLGNANLNSIAFLLPVLQNGFVPTDGESFTFMNYSALSGTFFIFDRNIDNVMEHWNVTYQANNATLTVAPGNVSVPDRGSTLLLLTLSLLGLATYRQKSWE